MGLIAPGAPFPDFPLRDTETRSQRPSGAWADGPALFAIGHGDCGTTRLALPYVDRIHARRGRGVVAILQEDRAGARDLITQLGLALPALLDEDPYPLASALGLGTVPTLVLVEPGGLVSRVVEGFDRSDLERLAAALGADGPLFAPEDEAPAFRPG